MKNVLLVSAAAMRLPVLFALLSGLLVVPAHAASDCAFDPTAVQPLRVTDEELAEASIAPEGGAAGAGFQINLVAGPGIQSNTAALAAFERAAKAWEDEFRDPITVTINIDLAALGSGIIGSTLPVLLEAANYASVRNAMATDAADEGDNGIAAFLPSTAQFTSFVPNGFSLTGVESAKAVLKALGFSGLDASFGASDGAITFSTLFPFDFDNSNGVTAGMMDFETVAMHEIGHLLGFISYVDTIDFTLNTSAFGEAWVSPLDMYRFPTAVAQNPSSQAQFTTFARTLVPGAAANFDDITSQTAMSTGFFHGDGRQASHWRDDALVGSHLGVMDPTLGLGDVFTLQESDIRALDLIGYDRGDEPAIVCGDANVDGNVTAVDALATLRAAVGAVACVIQRCDYNGDGQVKAVDALQVLRAAVGLQSTPNCPA